MLYYYRTKYGILKCFLEFLPIQILLPVKLVSLEQNEIFRKIVNSVQSDYTIEQTKYIDTLLFDLYNLTTEERKVIGYVEIK